MNEITIEVALRKESVDRNSADGCLNNRGIVALRKESVDRNDWSLSICFQIGVALRKESVDRNVYLLFCINHGVKGRSPQGERG